MIHPSRLAHTTTSISDDRPNSYALLLLSGADCCTALPLSMRRTLYGHDIVFRAGMVIFCRFPSLHQRILSLLQPCRTAPAGGRLWFRPPP